MSTPIAIVALLAGLGLLVFAADEFVVGAEAVALRLKWSTAVIGAVVVGFGTSLPELTTSVLAAGRGEADLAIGNAAGSNVANLLLILGVAALVAPLRGRPDQGPRRDGAIAAAAGVLLLLAALGERIGTVEAAVLVLALLASITWQVRTARTEPPAEEVPLQPARRFVGLRVVGGLAGVLVGAHLLVVSATALAEQAGVPPIVIGSVLVAVGTSLPELATAIASARRGQVELLLGNLLGSNVFNALGVVGAAGLVAAVRGDALDVATPAFAVVAGAAVVTAAAAAVLAFRPSVSRIAGAVLVALHLASVPLLLAIS